MFLHNFEHRRPPNGDLIFLGGIYIKYKKINTVCHSKRGFIDHKCKQETSHITVADDNMQDQHCSCIAGDDSINVHLTS